LSFFQIVVTSVWQSAHYFLFIAIQLRPGLEAVFAAPRAVLVSV
jgi:hypothetical protein